MRLADEGTSESRRPGRPPQTDAEAQRARDNILKATELVFAESGYHGINVAKIIDAAGIARPTFYRYFRNTDEALGMALHGHGRALGWSVVSAVRQADGAVPKVLAAIDAYLTWCIDNSRLLRSLYAGMHDPTSLVFALRPLLTDRLVAVIGDQFEQVGRARPAPATLDLLINSMEFAGFRLHLDTPSGGHDEADVALTRLNMTRVALALIGSADDWRSVVEHPESLRLFTGEGLTSNPV
jgi:AcrR family transcriptional regulator